MALQAMQLHPRTTALLTVPAGLLVQNASASAPAGQGVLDAQAHGVAHGGQRHSRLGHDAAAAYRDRLRVEVKPQPVPFQEPQQQAAPVARRAPLLRHRAWT